MRTKEKEVSGWSNGQIRALRWQMLLCSTNTSTPYRCTIPEAYVAMYQLMRNSLRILTDYDDVDENLRGIFECMDLCLYRIP